MRCKFLLIFFLVSVIGFAGNWHKNSSVLSSGKWWKVSVSKTGIYKISYQDLIRMDIDPSSINPSTIRVFGNGGRMLPESNETPRTDDLREIAISVVDGGDGKLDPGDYLIFYATGPDGWDYDSKTGFFHHYRNLYSRLSFYYITAGGSDGKRISNVISLDTIPGKIANTFTDHSFHEAELYNLLKSGKQWAGELLDNNKTTETFSFNFPMIIDTIPVRIETSVISRSSLPSNFFVSVNENPVDTIGLEFTDLNSQNLYARSRTSAAMVPVSDSQFSVTVAYSLPNSTSQGWIDNLEVTCHRALNFTGSQMPFRVPESAGNNQVTRFNISGITHQVMVWDVTNEDEIKNIQPIESGNTFSFITKTDTLKEFVAFDGSYFDTVQIIGKVANQDLHASSPATLVIVAPSVFMDEAKRLADFHRSNDSLSTLVVNVDDVYNEFSSGKKDITAIRDFLKMLYDRSTTEMRPQYLLLFGDGSYDPENRVPGNNDLLPTFQSNESLRPIGTYVTDDYFGIMGDKEGSEANGTIEIGTGRFPVSTPEEAKIIVDKIIHYSGYSDTIYSDWKNVFTFIADDENNNLHFHQAEQVVKIVENLYPVFNVNKIYLDAYKMVSTPAGDRLPAVNNAINKAIEDGTLILNYTGHGGEDGWSAEKVLSIGDIQGWNNYDKLPVFITATCEFSRFDNPERLTAGEMVLLHPHGGAIALYSTTRQALATSNFKLDTSFFRNLIPGNGLPDPKMGDLIRISKNRNGNNYSIRNFVLLGDPAQQIEFPKYNVAVTEINNHPDTAAVHDTAMGLDPVTVKGEIRNYAGQKDKDFNGEVFIKFYDKPTYYMTIGNTSGSYPEQFKALTNLLFYGPASVKNGDFTFSMVIPANVLPKLGESKMSFYARNGVIDANGYSKNLVVGGIDSSVTQVNDGPVIDLYMDDPGFRNGGKTGKNTVLLAFFDDPEGINFLNLGIGHEIIAELDGDGANPIVLNEWFRPEPDHYGVGSVEYSFNDLSTGRHTIKVKAWDMYNNNSSKEIFFYVDGSSDVSRSTVYNYPNPVLDGTTFSFTSQGISGQLFAQIVIYDHTGQKVKTLTLTFNEQGGNKLTIYWDGRGENGNLLPPGLYLYKLITKGEGGSVSEVNQKLIIRTR